MECIIGVLIITLIGLYLMHMDLRYRVGFLERKIELMEYGGSA